MEFNEILEIKPYSLQKHEKNKLLAQRLKELTKLHYENCDKYARVLDVLDSKWEDMDNVQDCPFLPVRMFKDMELRSIPENEVFKTMTSSGTTGQQVSKIFLNITAYSISVLLRSVASLPSKYIFSPSRQPITILVLPMSNANIILAPPFLGFQQPYNDRT